MWLDVLAIARLQGITTAAGGCLATRLRRLGGTIPGRPDYPYLTLVVLGAKVRVWLRDALLRVLLRNH